MSTHTTYPAKDLHGHIWDINQNEFPTSGKLEDVCLFLLRYAVLAPSVHNTQPWACEVSGGKIKVHYSTAVSLRDSDPTQRQTYLSFGAFVANIVLAAETYGYTAAYAWMPEGYRNLRYCAEVTISGSASTPDAHHPTLQAMLRRRNYRGKFKNVGLTPDQHAALGKLTQRDTALAVITDKPQLHLITKILHLAARFGFTNEKFRRELADFIVPNYSKRSDGIPGYAAGLHNNLSSGMMPILMRRFNISEWQGSSLRNNAATAPAIGIIGGVSDAYEGWLASGFLLQKTLLKLTELGLSHSIWAAPIEVPTASQRLQKMLGLPFRPHITFGIGIAEKLPHHSARKPVADILITGK